MSPDVALTEVWSVDEREYAEEPNSLCLAPLTLATALAEPESEMHVRSCERPPGGYGISSRVALNLEDLSLYGEFWIQRRGRTVPVSSRPPSRRVTPAPESASGAPRAPAAASAALDDLDRFRALAGSRQHVLTEWTDDLICSFASEGAAAFFGSTVDAMLGRSLTDFIDATDGEPALPETWPTEREAKVTLRMRAADRGWRWVESLCTLYTRRDGERRILAVSHDVTDRKASERALIEADHDWRKSPDGLFVCH